MDPSGEPVAEVGMRKLRKSPPLFGVMRAGERAHFPELREPTVALLRAQNWRGMANVEYKLDPRDGRCFLMMGLARRLGVNHALLSWQEKGMKQGNLAASLNDWNGVWVHLLADVYYGLFCQGIEKLGFDSYLRSYRRPKTFAVWSAGGSRTVRHAVGQDGPPGAADGRFNTRPPQTLSDASLGRKNRPYKTDRRAFPGIFPEDLP